MALCGLTQNFRHTITCHSKSLCMYQEEIKFHEYRRSVWFLSQSYTTWKVTVHNIHSSFQVCHTIHESLFLYRFKCSSFVAIQADDEDMLHYCASQNKCLLPTQDHFYLLLPQHVSCMFSSCLQLKQLFETFQHNVKFFPCLEPVWQETFVSMTTLIVE